MDCAQCGETNRDGARFCGECGAPLARRCSSCDAELDPRQKFCDGCGTPTGAAAASAPTSETAALPAASGGAARKTVTVLFADLAGSTSFGERIDAEVARSMMALRQQQTRLTDSQRSEIVERYEAGELSNALAAEFKVDRRTVTRIIRSAGGEVRYRVDADVEVARALYESGFSLARVGEELGVSARSVLNLFRRAGIPTRAVGTNQWAR